MCTEQVLTNSELISEDNILKQVEKILVYPLFAVSDILQNFLKYIIHETLSGSANQLKEYTIAVYALNKPPGFRPLHDGIVRVHARRLRDALHSYYNDQRDDDFCEITVPKGSYIPVFKSLKPKHTESDEQIMSKQQTGSDGKMRIAIMPFKSFEETNHRLAFADNIGRTLSSEFVHFANFAVLSYYTTQLIKTENRSIKSITSEYGIQYILSGNVQFEHKKVRVAVQLINAGTEILLWSEMYTHDFIVSNSFETEDAIVCQVISALETYSSQFSKQKSGKLPELTIGEAIDKDIISFNEIRRKKTV
jgi:TolB-like protein